MKKHSLNIAVIFALLVAVVIVIITYNFVGFSEMELKSHIKDNKWKEAVSIYNEHIIEDERLKDKYQPIFTKHINDTFDNWCNGESSYKDSKDLLSACCKLDDSKLSSLSRNQLSILNIEHKGITCLEQAEKYFDNDEYMNTFTELSKIDNRFSQYEVVSTFKNECKTIILAMTSHPQTEDEYFGNIEMLKTCYNISQDTDFDNKVKMMENEKPAFDSALPVMTSISNLYNEEKYKEAFSALDQALIAHPNNRFLNEFAENCQEGYIYTIAQKVREKTDNREFNDAQKIIADASSAYNCDEFKELSDVVKKNSNPAYRVSQNIKDAIARSKAISKQDVYSINDVLDDGTDKYIIRSGKKMVLGDYSEDEVTLLSFVGRNALAISGMDLGLDLVDLQYDITHWGEDDYFVFRLATDVVALVPVIGVVKYIKNSPDAAKQIKGLKILGKTESAQKTMNRIIKLSKTKLSNVHIQLTIASAQSKHYKFVNSHNLQLAGKRHPTTGVKFVAKKLRYSDGRKIYGVYPMFKSKYNKVLPVKYRKATFETQKRYLISQLRKHSNKYLGKRFTAREIKQIRKGELPSKYVWHHNEKEGLMQVVLRKEHDQTAHKGGMSLWGLGYKTTKQEAVGI